MTIIVKVNHGVKDMDIVYEQKWQAGHTGDHRMLLLVGEVSPIPTETMINHRATLPFVPVPFPKGGRYLLLQSEYLAFLF